MRFRTPVFLIALLAGTALGAATPQFSADRVVTDVKTLSSDAFEGRGPATRAEAKTIDYIVAQMKAAGLSPAGSPGTDGKRGWTQDVPLLRSDIVGTPALSFQEDGRRTSLTQGDEIAVRAPMDGSRRIDINNAPMVFVGYGVKAPERGWDDFKGVDLRGKIMVVLVNDPDFEGGEGDFGGKAMTYYGRWTYKYEEGARQGAAGVLIIHETLPAAYGWQTVRNSNTNTMFDIVRDKPAAQHPPIEAWIQQDVAAKLFAGSGLDFAKMKQAAQRKDFRPVPLKAGFNASFDVKSDVSISHNVAGMLTGKSRPDEYVIYSAHWDHLGVGAPDARGDTIYNGALDNASGVAALLELARGFATAPRTARSLVFLAVTAEEKGLLGSEYYAANPLFPLEKTAGVINLDGPFAAGRTKDFTISGSAKLGLLDMLSDEARRQGRVYTPDSEPEAGMFYRSDHFSFAKRGVPALSYGGGEDMVEGGKARGRELSEAYTRDRYHQPADQFDSSWDVSSVPYDLALLYGTGRRLADGGDWPNWSTDSEFRATRDSSGAARK